MFNRRCARPDFIMPMQDSMIDIDNNQGNIDIDLNQMQSVNVNSAPQMVGGCQSPIVEPMQERVVQRTIMHEVPHVCPIRTKIVNNHVFRHTYQPSYSCCEENTVQNVQCGSCCNFR